jgi:hypothetical protein
MLLVFQIAFVRGREQEGATAVAEEKQDLLQAETKQLSSEDSSGNDNVANKIGCKNAFHGNQMKESQGLLLCVFNHPANKYGVKGSSCTTNNALPYDSDCWTDMRTRTKRTRGTENPDAFIRLNIEYD